MGWLAPVVIVALVIAVAGSVWLVLYLRRSNMARDDHQAAPLLAELAARNQWYYEPENIGFADMIPGYPVYGGDGKKSRQLVHGIHRGHQFCVFQYRSLSSASIDSATLAYRVFAVALPVARPFPKIFIASRQAVSMKPRKGASVTTGDPEFDARFYVTSDDVRFAQEILTGAVRRFLSAAEIMWQLRLTVVLEGGVAYHSYEQKAHLDTATVVPIVNFLCDLADQISPSY